MRTRPLADRGSAAAAPAFLHRRPPGRRRAGFGWTTATGRTTYLSRCSLLRKEVVWNCYVTPSTRRRREVQGPGARSLPRIDKKVARPAGGYLMGNCHMIDARRSAACTRARSPRGRWRISSATCRGSNDPGLLGRPSAMGMVDEHSVRRSGGWGRDGAVQMCLRARRRASGRTPVSTRWGHAYMRLYQRAVEVRHPGLSRTSCEAGTRLWPRGAYHDYWLGIAGRDNAKRQRNAVTTATGCFAGRAISSFVRPCWYRYFLELPPKKGAPKNAGRRPGGCAEGPLRRAAGSAVSPPQRSSRLRIRSPSSTSAARLRRVPTGVSCLYGLNVPETWLKPPEPCGSS